MSEQLYTSSRLRVFRECIVRHHFQYILAIRTPSTPAMQFGTVAHEALEAYFVAWRSGWMDMRLPHAVAAIDRSPLSPWDKAKLTALIVAYHLRWGAEPWEVLAVEVQFRYVLDGALVGGKIDAIVRDTNTGRVYVLEHKTSSADTSPGSTYWERLSVDSQVSIYIDGAGVLGHEIAGCIYDVLKRPEHEQLLATPAESRRYTKGKGCAKCGGSAGGKRGIVQGRGHTEVVFASEVKRPECSDCKGTGWKCDDEGNPQAPRLDARQRDADETIEQFAERITEVVGERPDEFLSRGVIVRLDDELPRMREALAQTIALEQVTRAAKLLVPNHDACARYGSMCPFFAVCSGRASIDDTHLFPRGEAHPELAAA